MRLTRIRLQHVKRHADLELELAPGMTVVRGPNEAGKSTIQQAIELALFRRATSEARELDGVRLWGADEPPTVTVDFEDEGIRGRLVKVFAGNAGTVELTTEAGVERDAAAIEHVIASLTGLPSEKFFRATASIHHQDLADLKQDEGTAGTLRDRLQQSMSGARRGTHAAKRKLEEAIRRYRSEGPKNPGYLKVARADVERLQAEVSAGEAALQQLEQQRRALADARDRRAAVDAELAGYQQGLAAAERAVALHDRAAAAERRYTTYRRAAELEAEIAQVEAAPPTSVPLATLRSGLERLRNLELSLSEMRAELAAEPEVRFEPIPVPRWRPLVLLAALLALTAGLAVVVGALLGQLLLGAVVAVVAGAVALLGGLRGRTLRARVPDVHLQNELRAGEIDRRLRGRIERSAQVLDSERERDETLAAFSLTDLAAGEQLVIALTEHSARLDQLRAELRGLLGEDAPSGELGTLRDQAAAELDECRHALSGMAEIGAQPHKSLAAYRAMVERLRGEREQALAVEAQAGARVDANAIDADQVAAASEALATAVERLAHVERRLRIYETTLKAIQGAEAATMKKAARFLEQSMGGDIDRITDGRYRRLQVDEAELRFRVFSAERGEWVDALELSQGTIDQLYLCARLGIVRQVTQPASPPLVFDDPFVTFDPDRAKRAVELLREVAGELQVIYLTCSDRYDEIADKVIVLDGPTARDDAVDAAPEPIGEPEPAPLSASAA
jgi:DNA repair exonuclease SbcCD ATPase subunit